MRKLAWLSLVLALLLALAACGGDDDETAADTGSTDTAAAAAPLNVYAAASLTEVFPMIDPAPRYNFAGSDELATQIREGAPADVYAAASSKYPQELFGEGLVEEPVTFASNRLVLIVPKDNPAGIEKVSDVTKPGTKLVIAAEGVPVGDYTREVLDELGLNKALDNVVSNEEDVKGVVGKVTLGEADAGFVYATDAAVAADDVTVIELPEGSQPPIEYQIAVVSSSENKEAAQAFVDDGPGPGRQGAARGSRLRSPLGDRRCGSHGAERTEPTRRDRQGRQGRDDHGRGHRRRRRPGRRRGDHAWERRAAGPEPGRCGDRGDQGDRGDAGDEVAGRPGPPGFPTVAAWASPRSGSTVDDVRAYVLTLPRAYEVFVRGRIKFRVGQIVFLAFSRDATHLDWAVRLPQEWRRALVERHEPLRSSSSPATPTSASLAPVSSWTRSHEEEMRELVLNAWAMASCPSTSSDRALAPAQDVGSAPREWRSGVSRRARLRDLTGERVFV